MLNINPELKQKLHPKQKPNGTETKPRTITPNKSKIKSKTKVKTIT